MGKFKVGDRVNLLGCDAEESPGVVHAVWDDDVRVLWETNDSTTTMSAEELFVVTPVVAPATTSSTTTGAIRTVTRREIVPGVVKFDSGAQIRIKEVIDYGNAHVVLDNGYSFTPKALRAAAALFNELADVLDEQAVASANAGGNSEQKEAA